MTANNHKIWLFVHVIVTVRERKALLKKPIRTVLFAHLQKDGSERGIRLTAVNGVDDHIHLLVQLHPAQNLLQVIKSLKSESANWINNSNFLAEPFEWEEAFAAYTVSPSGVKQVADFIGRQEEYHQSKSLESELEVFDKVQL
ncbi:IS200/IS605 family transposase [Pseudoflavitalea sp. G-6-1-2]|uniref:IS200/IS605 family transposase n=1 Tax=Pseudoflavitalea sp. G-6-1-2 TaxID=2728841 RepID=UPI00146CB89C|nr:IS200/IS605 family transposase [Pseudoflavitalea sp. G-6-1-2]